MKFRREATISVFDKIYILQMALDCVICTDQTHEIILLYDKNSR